VDQPIKWHGCLFRRLKIVGHRVVQIQNVPTNINCIHYSVPLIHHAHFDSLAILKLLACIKPCIKQEINTE